MPWSTAVAATPDSPEDAREERPRGSAASGPGRARNDLALVGARLVRSEEHWI
ncbi:hypothetical protein SAMN02982929_01159 [Saccharopolyspora kobensis]|uniref:Uncharacterized protein n=1 Tax=Saccharopolyspora kobensis TaxID=146035 RepID=A0A1H5WF72_9PSEU|nr:hypothetical protein SAMN02982929_01159 [Saccharopolyspora kobensis]SFD74986.1 hypothetical protein SAMN05216506_106132 [Saccharopolyspora kobensis]